MTLQADLDRHFLNYAIKLGLRGLGATAPNPSVGAVVVANNSNDEAVIVGEGSTAPGGRPHAEPQALAMAGDLARGATLYVSLEPCSHHGKTPPCTNAIIAAGVGRVVCELADVDPRVSCDGFQAIQQAGITVTRLTTTPAGVLAHAGHIRRTMAGRPFVTVKMAVSADGLVAPGDGTPRWVTGPQARARGHLLRARADAILVGAGTVRADNPSLTCRLGGLSDRSPIPVVLDTRQRAVPSSRLAREQGTRLIVFTASEAPTSELDCVVVPHDDDTGLETRAVLSHLKARGVTRLLVEGGPSVAETFLDADAVDEIIIFKGQHHLGGGESLQPFGSKGLADVIGSGRWCEVQRLQVGDDAMFVYQTKTLIEDLTGTQTCLPD